MRVVIEFEGIDDAGVADNILYEVYRQIGKIIEFSLHERSINGFSMRIERDEYEG